MTQNGYWQAYAGSEAIELALALLIITGILVFLGFRLRRPIGTSQPGKTLGVLMVIIWLLSIITLLVAVTTYNRAFIQAHPDFKPLPNPISRVTNLSALVTFIVIAILTWRYGFKIALVSAFAGAAAAPMIFELPFDLIVMWRTYPPSPPVLYTLLYFLPLFMVEFSTFSLLTFSPATKLSKYTFFALAAMFFVFAVWAVFGFSYPLAPLPIAFNALSKLLCFVTAITLFLPQKEFGLQAS
jgi:uncharacterized membrane protein YidH (DUF202 family)